MRKVQISKQYVDGKRCWALFPAETTTTAKYKDHTAILLGTFKTRKAAEQFCVEKNWQLVPGLSTRLIPECNHYPNREHY